MTFHWLTHVGGAITALSVVTAWIYFFHAFRGLRDYLRRPQRKAATGKGLLHTPLPLLLRILYFVCATTTILGNTGLLATNWLYVEPNIRQNNIFKPVYQPDLTPSSKACIFIDKFAPTNYAFVKAICYLFLFIKQRTVRTMQPKLHWLEKIALQNTLSIAALLPCAAWLIQGDQSPLDSTCVMAVEPWLTLILLGADVALSLIYLYLFIQPLRATIKANQQRFERAAVGAATAASNVEMAMTRQPTLSHHHVAPAPSPSAKRMTGGGTAATATLQVAAAGSPETHSNTLQRHSPPAPAGRALSKLTINPSAAQNGSPMHPPASSPTGSPPSPLLVSTPLTQQPSPPTAVTRLTPSTQSSMLPPAAAAAPSPVAAATAMDRSTGLKLEAVMRRNTKACICTLVISTISMSYCSAAMWINDPYMRKMVSPLALIDSCLIVSMLCYVLSGSSPKSQTDAQTHPTAGRDREGHIASTARPSGVAQPSKGGWVGGGGGGASRVGGGGGVQPIASHAAAAAAGGAGPVRHADPMIVEPDLEAAVPADPRDLEQVDELGVHDDAGIED